MKSTSFRRAIAPSIATLTLGLTLAACGAANEETPEATPAPSDGETSEAPAGLSGTLNGGGASSQEAAQAAWRAGFQTANPEVTVNYDPIGSGGGRENFISGAFSFAGSDAYLDDEEGELSGATERCGSEPIQVPAYVSPIALVFNLEGVDELNLSPEAITGIFEGDITSWNDDAIAADNPDIELPDTDIVPVHRSDESGTTENFTEYLSAAGGWSAEPSGDWPIDGGEAGNGTSGVIDAVTNGTGTIGYADASQAGSLSVASVKVGEEYVAPAAEAAAAIIGASPRVDESSDVNLAVDIDHETEAAGTYPIVLASYMLACTSYEDAAEAELVKGYLTYVVGPEGQAAAAEGAGSAPLAGDVQEQALAVIEAITGP